MNILIMQISAVCEREYGKGGTDGGRGRSGTLVRISRSQLRANPILFRVTSAGSSMKRQYFPTSVGTEENAMASKIATTVAGLQLQPVADLAEPDGHERVTKTLFLPSGISPVTIFVRCRLLISKNTPLFGRLNSYAQFLKIPL